MDTITFKGLTTDEVPARVRAGQTNDAHEETTRSLKDILRVSIPTRCNALLLALFVVVAMRTPQSLWNFHGHAACQQPDELLSLLASNRYF